MTRRYPARWILALLVALLVLACAKVPITGRRQLSLIPGSTLTAMSFTQYEEFLATHPRSRDGEQTAMVKRIGARIRYAVERFYTERGQGAELGNYAWEFNLVEDPQQNAWCMPGGKVVVYTGILPVTRDETGLAVVMGHEIAHAVANHGNERMSQALVANFGGIAFDKLLENKPAETRQLFLTAYGVGAQVGFLLPYSRLQESEADHLGLLFMAMAGYDPRAAVPFWERMAAQKQGSAPPEFLSTHPADATRIRKLRELLPDALAHYQAVDGGGAAEGLETEPGTRTEGDPPEEEEHRVIGVRRR